MVATPGEIRISWNGQGHVHVEAPLDNKELCGVMLAEALKAIMTAIAPLVLPAAPNGPPPRLHHKR